MSDKVDNIFKHIQKAYNNVKNNFHDHYTELFLKSYLSEHSDLYSSRFTLSSSQLQSLHTYIDDCILHRLDVKSLPSSSTLLYSFSSPSLMQPHIDTLTSSLLYQPIPSNILINYSNNLYSYNFPHQFVNTILSHLS